MNGLVALLFLVSSMRAMGVPTPKISRPPAPPDTRLIRDNGHGQLVRRWDHLITIMPDPLGTHYQDTVEIEAGALIPVMWAFAQVFYKWRQHRWRRLVRSGFGS